MDCGSSRVKQRTNDERTNDEILWSSESGRYWQPDAWIVPSVPVMSLCHRLLEIESKIPFEDVDASWATRREGWIHELMAGRHDIRMIGELTNQLCTTFTEACIAHLWSNGRDGFDKVCDLIEKVRTGSKLATAEKDMRQVVGTLERRMPPPQSAAKASRGMPLSLNLGEDGPRFKDKDKCWALDIRQVWCRAEIVGHRMIHPAASGMMEYRVHYIGWKKAWDEWVARDSGRLVPDQPAGAHRATVKRLPMATEQPLHPSGEREADAGALHPAAAAAAAAQARCQPPAAGGGGARCVGHCAAAEGASLPGGTTHPPIIPSGMYPFGANATGGAPVVGKVPDGPPSYGASTYRGSTFASTYRGSMFGGTDHGCAEGSGSLGSQPQGAAPHSSGPSGAAARHPIVGTGHDVAHTGWLHMVEDEHTVKRARLAGGIAGGKTLPQTQLPVQSPFGTKSVRVLPGDRIWFRNAHGQWNEASVVATRDKRVKVQPAGPEVPPGQHGFPCSEEWLDADSTNLLECAPRSAHPPAPSVRACLRRVFALTPPACGAGTSLEGVHQQKGA